MIFRLASRNVARQRRRSALTVLAVVACFALLIVSAGLSDGAHEQMIHMGVRMGLGDVLVYREGYLDTPSIDRLVDDPKTVIEAAHGLGPRVTSVAPRLKVDALAQAGPSSVGVSLLGVDPAVEAKASKIGSPESIVDGHALADDGVAGRPPPVVVGKALAKTLGVRVGDRVTFTVRPAGGGGMKTGAFEIEGIFATGVHDIDAFWAQAPLESVRRLVGTKDAVTTVALLVRSSADVPSVQTDLAAAIHAKDKHLDVVPWQKAAPELYATIVLDEGGMYLTLVIVFIIVAAGILNTILMSVLERTREFGVLLALGARPGRVVSLVLAEAVILGVISVGLGLALGLGLNHYFTTTGLDVRGSMGTGVEASGVLLPDRIFSHLSPVTLAWSTAAVALLVVAGAVYPALLAARLQPVEAIRRA